MSSFYFSKVSEHGEELSANVCRLDSETGNWEVETELPAQRSHHCLAVLGGFIFAAGGSSSRDNGGDAACNLLYRYDPRHNHWTRVSYQSTSSIFFNNKFHIKGYVAHTEVSLTLGQNGPNL